MKTKSTKEELKKKVNDVEHLNEDMEKSRFHMGHSPGRGENQANMNQALIFFKLGSDVICS